MLDNPTDLVQPRGEQQGYTGRRAVAMDKYRKGENPSGTYTGLRHWQRSARSGSDQHASGSPLQTTNRCRRRQALSTVGDEHTVRAPRVGAGFLPKRSRLPPPCRPPARDRRLGKAHAENPDGRRNRRGQKPIAARRHRTSSLSKRKIAPTPFSANSISCEVCDAGTPRHRDRPRQ